MLVLDMFTRTQIILLCSRFCKDFSSTLKLNEVSLLIHFDFWSVIFFPQETRNHNLIYNIIFPYLHEHGNRCIFDVDHISLITYTYNNCKYYKYFNITRIRLLQIQMDPTSISIPIFHF